MFEHLDLDLKKFMDSNKNWNQDHQLIKVSLPVFDSAAVHSSNVTNIGFWACKLVWDI